MKRLNGGRWLPGGAALPGLVLALTWAGSDPARANPSEGRPDSPAAAPPLDSSPFAPPMGQPGQTGQEKDSAAHVKVEATAAPATPGEDGQQLVSITLAIDKGWHIGANQPGEAGIATQVAITSSSKEEEVQVEYPPGRVIHDSVVGDYRVYEGTVVIKARVHRNPSPGESLPVSVKFAACSSQTMQCLPAATVRLRVP